MDFKDLADSIANAHNAAPAHSRFYRDVWAFRKDFTGALAKWLVKQSPYTVPDNLASILEDFNSRLDVFNFDETGMALISLQDLTPRVYAILETIPEARALNIPKSRHNCNVFVTRYSTKLNPDDDFIDLVAVAQNITCEFADRADAEAYLEEHPDVYPLKEDE